MWKVLGLIVGPKLPIKKLKLENCTIEKINPQKANHIFNIRTQTDVNITSEEIVVVLPIKKTVKSLHEFSIKIDANSRLDAIEKGQKELDIILVILSLSVGGMRYHANIKQAIPLNSETSIESHSLKGIEFSLYGSSNIYEIEIRKYTDYYSQLKDSTFEECLNLLGNAWKLLDAKNSGPIDKPLLQTYFKILEGISNRITSDWKKDQKKELVNEQSNLISNFLNSNKNEKTKKELLKNFKKTHRELLRLENQYLSLKIEYAGKKLKINHETINDAIELNKIRNKVLSHFSSTEKIDPEWLENVGSTPPNKAEMICRTYLRAYANYISQ